jgi:hypothetical protein
MATLHSMILKQYENDEYNQILLFERERRNKTYCRILGSHAAFNAWSEITKSIKDAGIVDMQI